MSATSRKRSPLRALAITLGFVVAGIVPALTFATPHAKAATNWSLIWSDEFNGAAGSGVDTSNWKYDTGPGSSFGTGEIETMTSSANNVHLDGQGHLVITPIRDSGGAWTSGRIETQRDDFAAPAGGELAVESSIELPNVTGSGALGYWPAFWMLGSGLRGGGTWPSVGEIDTVESVDGTNNDYGTLHCGVDPGGPCNETNGLGGHTPCAPTICHGAFHTYRVEVDRGASPEQIRWYLDGVQFWQVSSNTPGMDPTTWANAVDHPFFIIYDLAMGGGFPNGVCGCTTPQSSTQSGVPMIVDDVRVYTSGSPTPTATPVPPTSTPAPAGCGTANLALSRPATASSLESSADPASAAVDGATGTRWSSGFSDPQWLQVDLGSVQSVCKVVLNWEAAYGKQYQIQVSNDAQTWTTIYNQTNGQGGVETLNVSGSGRYIRMYGTQRATGYGYSLWEFQVFGGAQPPATAAPAPAGCGTANLALSRPATASSLESSADPASAAVDGNPNTRWSSQFSDPQWLQVDLGSTRTLCKVALSWEAAYGKQYQIQTSNDAQTWTTIYTQANGQGGVETLNVSGSGRYVRMYGTARGTGYGYSLWEFGLYGS